MGWSQQHFFLLRRRQDMQELRGALNSVEVAWQEATDFCGANTGRHLL